MGILRLNCLIAIGHPRVVIVRHPICQTLPSRDDQPSEEKTYFAPSLSFLTCSYRETLFAEFERLVEAAKQFDGLIIDLMQTGFSVPLDELVKFRLYAKRLLSRKACCSS